PGPAGALRWAPAGWTGLRPRYEHATFLTAAAPPRLWVFGGADPAGNRSCVQVLDTETGSWESPAVDGEPPLPRTFHTSAAAIGAHLYVFGGGERGAEPVRDQQLHVFDTDTLSWSQPATRGAPPSPRHGHVMAAVGTKLFVHGGLAGDTFYSDLFCLDTTDMRWVKVSAGGDVPAARASHASAVFRDHVYIFGGIGLEGTLDTTYKYHTEQQQWTLLQFDGPLPAGRLDQAMCVIPWHVGESHEAAAAPGAGEAGAGKDQAAPIQNSPEGNSDTAVVHLLLVFGGMNMQGEVYSDCLVTLLE
ncbi:RABEK protein, partial [Urocolius indicus]|nr:RABEK protein [Urocolius indicus]